MLQRSGKKNLKNVQYKNPVKGGVLSIRPRVIYRLLFSFEKKK